MENINATATVDTVNNQNKIIREKSKTDANKYVIKVNSDKIVNILVTFNSTIINGKKHFFDNYKKLTFQLRITDDKDKERIDLNCFDVDLTSKENYYKTNYVDFKTENQGFIFNLNLQNLDFRANHFLSILVTHPKIKETSTPWIVQAAIPIEFLLNETD